MMTTAARLRDRRAIAASTHKSAATNSHMQASDGEKVNRTGLLKRLFNVLWRFVPDAEHDFTDETFYLGRIVQAAAQRVLHPRARCLCSAQDWIAVAVADQRAVLRIPSEEHSTDITPRKVSAHIELAGISWRRDWLGGSKKFQFIAKLRRAFSTYLPDCACGFVFAFEFN
jgi:hypothetical protein